VEYTLIPEGEWNRIVLTTPSAEIQVEYYDPDLTIDGTLHSLSYRWIGDYPINDLTVVVQQPRGAYNVNINPYLGVGKSIRMTTWCITLLRWASWIPVSLSIFHSIIKKPMIH